MVALEKTIDIVKAHSDNFVADTTKGFTFMFNYPKFKSPLVVKHPTITILFRLQAFLLLVLVSKLPVKN